MVEQDTVLGSVREGVVTLFGPQIEEFVRARNNAEVFVHRGSTARLGELVSLCGDGDLRSFLERHRGTRTYVQLPSGTEGELTEKIWDRIVTGMNHIKAHPDGIPVVHAWHEALYRDLRLTWAGIGRTITLTVSDAGTGVAWHHDERLELFVIQLRGVKRWWVVPARGELATERLGLTVAHTGYGTNDLTTRNSLDERLTSRATTYDLEAGDVLYVPPYHWHRTEARETADRTSSWSLTFAFPQPRPVDLVRRALGAAIDAIDLDASEVIPSELELDRNGLLVKRPSASVQACVRELIAAVTRSAAEQLAEQSEPAPLALEQASIMLRRPPSTTMELAPADSFWWLAVTSDGTREEIPIAGSLLPIARWLATFAGPFSFLRACAEVPTLTRKSLLPLFELLLDCGGLVLAEGE